MIEPEAHKLAFFIIASEKQGVLVAGMSGVRVGRQKYMSKRSNSLIFIINGTQEPEEPRQIELQINWFKSISMCSLASANTNSQNCQKNSCIAISSDQVMLACTWFVLLAMLRLPHTVASHLIISCKSLKSERFTPRCKLSSLSL